MLGGRSKKEPMHESSVQDWAGSVQTTRPRKGKRLMVNCTKSIPTLLADQAHVITGSTEYFLTTRGVDTMNPAVAALCSRKKPWPISVRQFIPPWPFTAL